jgi:hypothetical protein
LPETIVVKFWGVRVRLDFIKGANSLPFRLGSDMRVTFHHLGFYIVMDDSPSLVASNLKQVRAELRQLARLFRRVGLKAADQGISIWVVGEPAQREP